MTRARAHIYDGYEDTFGRPCACCGEVQPPHLRQLLERVLPRWRWEQFLRCEWSRRLLGSALCLVACAPSPNAIDECHPAGKPTPVHVACYSGGRAILEGDYAGMTRVPGSNALWLRVQGGKPDGHDVVVMGDCVVRFMPKPEEVSP